MTCSSLKRCKFESGLRHSSSSPHFLVFPCTILSMKASTMWKVKTCMLIFCQLHPMRIFIKWMKTCSRRVARAGAVIKTVIGSPSGWMYSLRGGTIDIYLLMVSEGFRTERCWADTECVRWEGNNNDEDEWKSQMSRHLDHYGVFKNVKVWLLQ